MPHWPQGVPGPHFENQSYSLSSYSTVQYVNLTAWVRSKPHSTVLYGIQINTTLTSTQTPWGITWVYFLELYTQIKKCFMCDQCRFNFDTPFSMAVWDAAHMIACRDYTNTLRFLAAEARLISDWRYQKEDNASEWFIARLKVRCRFINALAPRLVQ